MSVAVDLLTLSIPFPDDAHQIVDPTANMQALSQLKDYDEDYESDDYFVEGSSEGDTIAVTESTPSYKAPHFTKPNDLVGRLERKEGDSGVKLKCQAGGYPEPSVTWFKNNKTLNQWSLANIHQGKWAIWMDNISVEDTGLYLCRVCNSIECIEATFDLAVTVNDSPNAAYFARPTDLDPKIVRPMGNMAQMKCVASGYPEPNITWTKDTQPIDNRQGRLTHGKWMITLVNLVAEDIGNYTCTVCNIAGCQSHTTELELTGKLDRIRTGESRSLFRPASQSIIIVDRDEDLSRPENLKVYSQRREEEEDEDEEDGPSTRPLDDGTAKQQQQHAPFFIKPGTMTKINMKPSGSTHTFKCKCGGYPEPNITWSKNNDTIMRMLGNVKRNRWTITLEDLIASDSGQYECKVCNPLGCIGYVYKLQVQGMARKRCNTNSTTTALILILLI